MKKIINKIFSIVLLLIGIFVISGCESKPPVDDNKKPEIKLPTTTKKASSDETIYVIVDSENQISSIKSSHHLTNAEFAKYEVHGKFLPDGHLNITNGLAQIEIKDEIAYVPSLSNHDSFFYTLNLDKEYYETKLPFSMKTTYKLNGEEVTSDKLKGASGEVELIFEFKPVITAHEYLRRNYVAQVQIPINIESNTITEANGALAAVIVGNTNTLAYMVMPGETKSISMKISTKSFRFDGIQAVYQPFDQMESVGGMINFDQLGISSLSQLVPAINSVKTATAGLREPLDGLFLGMDQNIIQIKDSLTADQLLMFSNLVAALTKPEIEAIYQMLDNDSSYTETGLPQKAVFTTLIKTIKESTLKLSKDLAAVSEVVSFFTNNHEQNLGVAQKYEAVYQNFLKTLDYFDNITNSLTDIVNLDFTDIKMIAKNKLAIIASLTSVDNNLAQIQKAYVDTISEMYFYADSFEPIATNMYMLVAHMKEILTSVATLTSSFTSLSAKIGEGISGSWFEATMVQPALTQFKGELDHVGEQGQPMGLIQSLNAILVGFGQLNLVELETKVAELHELYQFDTALGYRPVDAIYMGFQMIYKSLATREGEVPFSFFEGINKITNMKDLLSLIPDYLEMSLPSFLSEENEIPSSLQIVVKQKGI